MATNVHIHLHVRDLAASRAFYERFFGEGPVKERPGYVKFLPALGPVNLAMTEGGSPGSHSTVGHLGLQIDDPAVVTRELARVRAAGLAVREETGVDCCHANQDKFWVTDPDGVEWEVYHLNHDLPVPSASDACARPADGHAPACCVGGPATPAGA